MNFDLASYNLIMGGIGLDIAYTLGLIALFLVVGFREKKKNRSVK